MIDSGFSRPSLNVAPLRDILVVEPNDHLRKSLFAEFTRLFKRSAIVGAPTFEIAFNLLQSQTFDIVSINPGISGHIPSAESMRVEIVSQLMSAAPETLFLIITDSQSIPEALACEAIGAAAYLSLSGFDHVTGKDVLKEIASGSFAVRLSSQSAFSPELYFSDLSDREQDILNRVRARNGGVTLKDVYEQAARDLGGVDPQTIKRYHMQARSKLLREGIEPSSYLKAI